MAIIKKFGVPTGSIFIVEGDEGRRFECLSLGDYGNIKNIKADFLGHTDEINGVPHGKLLPLQEKWVITISSQSACNMKCIFCDVPKVGKGINATVNDLQLQIETAIKYGNFDDCVSTKRLNVHYARMGEPTFNNNVIEHAIGLKPYIRKKLNGSPVHPVVSTMLPGSNKNLRSFLMNWCDIKNKLYEGEAGLQFSINTTDDTQRDYMFSNMSLSLDEISVIGDALPMPVGRKYALNFAITRNSIISGKRLCSLFDTEKFMVKLTPIHETTSCVENNITTQDGYFDYSPYRSFEKDLIAAGFDVLVFVPSHEEDRVGKITCGNAILSGNLPEMPYSYTEITV